MDIIRKKIYNSWIYNFITWICQLSSHSFFFKADVYMEYKEKKIIYKETAFYKLGEWIGNQLEKIYLPIRNKWNESLIVNLVSKVLNYFANNTIVGRIIRQFRLVYLVPFYVYFDFGIRSVIPGFSGIWDELFMIAIVGWLFVLRVLKNRRYKMTSLDLPIMFFICTYLMLVFVKSPELDIAIEGFRAVTQYMIWFYLVYQLIDSKKTAYRLVWMFIFGIGMLGLHGIYQYVTGAPMLGNWLDSGETVATRAYSIVRSPNAFGSLMVLNIPVAFSMFVSEEDILKRLLALIATVCSGLGLIFSMSRGAWLVGFFGMLVFFFFVGKRLILPIVSVCLAIILNVSTLWTRLTNLFTAEYAEKTARGGRIYRWTTGITEWSEHKILGLGIGRYGGAVATNHKLSPFYMDNYYLKTLTESGIVGLSAFLLLLIVTIRQIFTTIRATMSKSTRILMFGLFSGMIAVLGHNITENIFEAPYMVTYFWSFAAIIMAMNRWERLKDEN